jgi:hypothetical protein
MPDISPGEPRNGRIVTFYSYKGGTGRTMALANVAWILASSGNRVLAADWDLESPGLHRFFAPFLDSSVPDAAGVVDLVRRYEWAAQESEEAERLRVHIPAHAQLQQYVLQVRNWTFPGGGSLEFLSPGKQNRDYLATLSALDWDNFHETLNGGEFIDAVRADMRRHYDYALIDSRTGLGDLADVCTVHLPDVLVDCFTLSTQGLEGAVHVARRIEEEYGWRGIRVLPVPMRVDEFEKDRAEASRVFAKRLFGNLPTDMTDAQRRAYWNTVEVPYRPYYAYEEMLAVFGDQPGVPGSMLSSYERITGYITDGEVTSLPVIPEELRASTRQRFDRKLPPESKQIIIEFLAEDQIWAEWIGAVLSAGGYMVRDRRVEDEPVGTDADASEWRTLTLVSAAYAAWLRGTAEPDGAQPVDRRDQPPASGGRAGSGRPDFAVYVAGARSVPGFAAADAVSLVGARDEGHAIELLDKLFRIDTAPKERGTPLPRYPGVPPRIFTARERNTQFTGREQDLRALREELRSYTTAVVRPIALLGTAGVGKTSEALEYVHRFRQDYDLVAWIDCQRAAEIDLQFDDLVPRLHSAFGVTVPSGATVEERARWALSVISDGTTVSHWLIVYDNAEDIDAVSRYLPAGGGQVLITSQNQEWASRVARWIMVDTFEQEESVWHLRRVVSSLTGAEAAELATALGNLPVAVTLVAAFLRNTLYPVADYLRQLAAEPSSALEIDALRDYPKGVTAAWDLSLGVLRQRSAAAARLLELFSVMGPNVALSLVYDRPMAELLERYDPALSEPLVMARVVQEATRLNLLRLDSATNEIQVHQIVQVVVRSRMTQEDLAGARADVQRLLLAAKPRREVDNPATWARYRLLWPHLGPADVVSSADNQVRTLLIDRLRYIYVLADFNRGITEANAVARRWEGMLAGLSDPAVARVLHSQLLQVRFNLANTLRALSRFEEARAMDEEVLAEQVVLLGADHPHALATAGSLAADLRALGSYPAALTRDSQTYPVCVSQYGEGHQRALMAANNLGVSYRLTGQVYEALHLDEQTLSRSAVTFGAGDPRTLTIARNVVRDRLEAGEYPEAAADAQRVYDECSAELGADSPSALDAQVLLGIALRSAGRLIEAGAQFADAMLRLVARFGALNATTLACRLSNSANLVSLERYGEAETEALEVLAEYERALGTQHPHALVCHLNLATALHLKGDHKQALVQVNTALEGLERVLGTQHPYSLAAAMVYAVLLAGQQDSVKAELVEARTANALAQTLGSAHPDTLRCRANLLLTRKERGEDTTAERSQAIDELESVIGRDHPTIATLRAERRVLRVLDPQPY